MYVCNLYRKICSISVPEGSHLCYNCEGLGCTPVAKHKGNKYIKVYQCPICKGNGYVDWIDNIIQKEHPLIGLFQDPVYIRMYCHINKKCRVVRRLAKGIKNITTD